MYVGGMMLALFVFTANAENTFPALVVGDTIGWMDYPSGTTPGHDVTVEMWFQLTADITSRLEWRLANYGPRTGCSSAVATVLGIERYPYWDFDGWDAPPHLIVQDYGRIGLWAGCNNPVGLFGPNITAGVWYHVAFTVNSGRFAQLYLNGVLEAEGNYVSKGMWTGPIGTGNDRVSGGWGGGRSLGMMHIKSTDFRIWNHVRTAAQINHFMSHDPPCTNALIAWWTFVEGPVDVCHGITGTLHGSARIEAALTTLPTSTPTVSPTSNRPSSTPTSTPTSPGPTSSTPTTPSPINIGTVVLISVTSTVATLGMVAVIIFLGRRCYNRRNISTAQRRLRPGYNEIDIVDVSL